MTNSACQTDSGQPSFPRALFKRSRCSRIAGAGYPSTRKTPPITVPVLSVPEGSLERHLARLERTRAERDSEAVGAALAGLREAASRPGSSETNLMPHFLRCANAYATLGEQCGVLREVFGEYREPVTV